jgi:hypothetical protein
VKSPIIIRIPPLPQTTTILALGFLLGCLLFTPMIAVVGKWIDPSYRDSVETIVGLFKDGMLLILGFYFAKVVNAGQQDMANRAIDAAAAAQPPEAKA